MTLQKKLNEELLVHWQEALGMKKVYHIKNDMYLLMCTGEELARDGSKERGLMICI